MGGGEYTYEVYHDWGVLPSSIQYGNTHGVVHDSHAKKPPLSTSLGGLANGRPGVSKLGARL